MMAEVEQELFEAEEGFALLEHVELDHFTNESTNL